MEVPTAIRMKDQRPLSRVERRIGIPYRDNPLLGAGGKDEKNG
jgi:hypothetical protein